MSLDILSDVLRTVRLRGALFFHVSGNRSWAAEAPPARDIASIVMPDCEHVMEYHVVTHGNCWARSSAKRRCVLRAATSSCFRTATRM